MRQQAAKACKGGAVCGAAAADTVSTIAKHIKCLALLLCWSRQEQEALQLAAKAEQFAADNIFGLNVMAF